MMKATARWVPPPERYQQLVKRARELDSKVIVGVCSKAEIERMEKLVDQLEKQAAEKADSKRQNDPRNRASGTLHQLWNRGHEARQAILKMQADRLGKKSSFSDQIFWHPELQALNPPPEFFEAPQDIGGRAPSFQTLEEADTLATEFGATVAALEALASKMSRYLNEWEDLSFEQQTRRLVMTLFAAGRANEYRTG
jgi:hypothetical protein